MKSSAKGRDESLVLAVERTLVFAFSTFLSLSPIGILIWLFLNMSSKLSHFSHSSRNQILFKALQETPPVRFGKTSHFPTSTN